MPVHLPPDTWLLLEDAALYLSVLTGLDRRLCACSIDQYFTMGAEIFHGEDFGFAEGTYVIAARSIEHLAKEMAGEAQPSLSPVLAKEGVKEAPLIHPTPIKRNEEQITALIKEVLEQAGALRSRKPNISVQGIAAKLASPPLFEQFRRAGAVASELNFQNYLAQRIGKLLTKTKC